METPGGLAVLWIECDQVTLIEEVEPGAVFERGVLVGETLDEPRGERKSDL